MCLSYTPSNWLFPLWATTKQGRRLFANSQWTVLRHASNKKLCYAAKRRQAAPLHHWCAVFSLSAHYLSWRQARVSDQSSIFRVRNYSFKTGLQSLLQQDLNTQTYDGGCIFSVLLFSQHARLLQLKPCGYRPQSCTLACWVSELTCLGSRVIFAGGPRGCV